VRIVLWIGQHSSRLKEVLLRIHPAARLDSCRRLHLRHYLDSLGIPALILANMSNWMTEAQGGKVIRFIQQLGTNRVNVMFDCEVTDSEGAKSALGFFAERRFDARLVWSPRMHNGKQPGSASRSVIN